MPMPISRRQFVSRSAALTSAVAATSLASRLYAGGGDTLRVGLVGCGGRGSGAAVNALSADPNVKLVAMGDLFGDMLETSLKSLLANGEVASKVDVPAERRFVGFEAYKQVIDHVDVVLLCTSPHYRPIHLAYAVEKGRHAFVEKPIATDPTGVRSVMETCKTAKAKNLSIVSGLCYRYEHKKRETLAHIHEGMVGDIVAIETYYLTGQLWHRGRKPEWTDMEYQNRNWMYFDWLGGDFNTEQHVHSLDKVAWVMGDTYPVKATSLGGRAQRTEPIWGNVYDHFSTVYEYANGVKAYSHCRQMNGTTGNVTDNVFGTKGTAELMGHRISDRQGNRLWEHRQERGQARKPDDMYQNEHDEFFASIRSGTPINNGEYMCKSTMMAVLARLSAYTGQTLGWDETLNNPLNLSPAKYEWGTAPQCTVAVPGVYKLPG